MNRRSFLKSAALVTAGSAIAAQPVLAADKKHRWKMVTAWPPGFPILQTGAAWFAKQVEVLSQGRLTIQVFAGGEIVPPLGVFDAVSSGSVQCGHSASYYWAGKAPASQWFTSVPFGLNAQGMNAWLYNGNGLKIWEEVYAPFGLIPRPAGNTGVQMGGWFNKEINSLADFKGLKMRIPGLGGKVLAKAGGSVVLLPASEIYTSLERGVIDATEWVGPAHDLRMGFHKVAKYYYGPGWHEPGSVLEIILNTKAYERLPDDLKAVVDTAAAATNIRMLSEFEKANAEALTTLTTTHKVDIRQFSKEILSQLKHLAEETLSEVAASNALAGKVHQDFSAFQKSLSSWSAIGEQAYYNGISG